MSKLGKYEILEEIGRGGFAVVYRARDTTLDRFVALKVLHPQLTTDPKFIQRFHQEARTAAGLRHPHIVTIHEVGEEGGQHYLAMEFLPGQPLSRLTGSEPLVVEQAISILEQVAGALDAIHQQGLIHRDVKPSNIRVDDEGQATLLDFGIVRAAEGTRLTTTMAVLGTPEYMAPEQANPKRWGEITPLTDVYALGVVAYEMLVGRQPFVGEATTVLHAHAYEEPPSPLEIVPDLGDDLAEVLTRALVKPPAERYPGAGALAAALRQVADTRAHQKAQQAELERLLAQARAACETSDWLTVQDFCVQAMQVDRTHPDALKMMAEATAGLQRESAEEAARRKRAERYREGEQALARGQWQIAIEAFEEVAAGNPDFRDVQDKLAQARDELQREEWYDEAIAHGEAGHWADACRAWLNVLRGRVEYRDLDAARRFLDATDGLLGQYDALQEQLEKALLYYESMAACAEQGDWEEVIEAGQRLLELMPDLDRPQAWMARARREMERQEAPREDRIRGQDGKEMVYVPAGVFPYGEEKEELELPGFWIDKTPVTNAEYARFVAASDHKPPKHWEVKAPPEEVADHPVTYVTWHDATAYAEWAGKRLPTEEQWEKAARGTDGREYPWGDWEKGCCNSAEAGLARTSAVGQYSPDGDSPCGCVDMAGNVWEWTVTGSRDRRVVRGGSWNLDRHHAHCAFRVRNHPKTSHNTVGFRCVSPVSPPSSES